MSGRDAAQAAWRHLADLRHASSEIESELRALKTEQRMLEQQIACVERRRAQTPRHRFWSAFGRGLFVVCVVWVAALGVAHLAVGP